VRGGGGGATSSVRSVAVALQQSQPVLVEVDEPTCLLARQWFSRDCPFPRCTRSQSAWLPVPPASPVELR